MFQCRIATLCRTSWGDSPSPRAMNRPKPYITGKFPRLAVSRCAPLYCFILHHHHPILFQSSLDACPFTHALHQSETAPLAKAPVGDLPAHRTLCMPALLDGTGRCVPCAKQWTAYCAPFTVARVCTIRGVSVLPISDTLKTPT